MQRLLSRFVELRPGEYRRTALLFLYFFLVVASFYILKPVRNALFLDALGAEKLPYVYLGYWVEGAERMQYKVRYRPLERLTRGGWERMPEREQKRLIASATAPRGRRREEALPAKDGLAAEYRITD